MMVDCHMRDGRTTFRFAGRGLAVEAMKRKPLELDAADDTRSIRCWVRWHVETQDWAQTQVQYLAPNSIAFVVAVSTEERDAFLASHSERPKRLRRAVSA